MAVALKRKRGTVSYREPSSDEDLYDSDEERVSRKQKCATPVRRSTRHQSTEAEQSSPKLAPVPPTEAPRADARHALRQRGKRRITYRDVSSDDEGDSDDEFEPEHVEAPQRRPHAKRGRPQRAQPSKSPRKRTSRKTGRQRMVLGAPLKRTSKPLAPKAVPIPTDGHSPPWGSLPYHVLLQIFVYASHPLHDENMVPTSSISWLVRTARLCSAFTKPALTALYRNPPIFAIKQNRRDLVRHLIAPPADAHEDHQVMVKRLELDVTQMSALTDSAHSVADLVALIAALTTLKEIDIFDPLDRPPYRVLKRMRRWHYPDELFTALRQSKLRLQSWRWNSTFSVRGPLWIKQIHADAAFQSLRDLTLTKYQSDPPRKPDEPEEGQPTAEELLAAAIAALPNLRALTFESCNIVNDRLLPLLPSSLVSLNITNCIYLISDALQAFLATHGARLEELILNHNQSLGLSFLVDLKRFCPRLEVLRMDLNYYSSLVMSSDNEPLYDFLLGEDETPTWPSALRSIDLEYLRNWSSATAINFFSSLIDSAEDLPWLRELRILAMVDVDWRQRADFRQKWTAKFEKVFAGRWKPPSPQLASLRAYREWEESQAQGAEKNNALLDASPESKVEAKVEVEHKEASESDSDVPLLPSRKRKGESWNMSRLRNRGRASAHYDETSENESGSDEQSSADDEPKFIQGRCHTVIFRLDNSRPREELYDEGDFLDDERSGDEEWTGNDVDDDEYAW